MTPTPQQLAEASLVIATAEAFLKVKKGARK